MFWLFSPLTLPFFLCKVTFDSWKIAKQQKAGELCKPSQHLRVFAGGQFNRVKWTAMRGHADLSALYLIGFLLRLSQGLSLSIFSYLPFPYLFKAGIAHRAPTFFLALREMQTNRVTWGVAQEALQNSSRETGGKLLYHKVSGVVMMEPFGHAIRVPRFGAKGPLLQRCQTNHLLPKK